ncbi:hypothetical protein [Brevibacillus gelatini]|uniref:Uncharacterized protein n=1 Tax=Brevibacillus gelatini TaxID=1655277 RepID=A0A3M8B6G1_9BACL|nr:hypothetical protein [Brevibacillus gelatini]RNB59038.1 hypothetical protein EDM57_06075 [Brevibacillus gelatini]
MSAVSQIFVFVIIAYVWFAWLVWRRRGHIQQMHGMVSAMAVGMLIGLIAGMLFGLAFQGSLSRSTLWGMSAGAVAGFFVGLPLSALTVIEGTLSGLMAGMMGAMLGEMITLEQAEPLLFFLVMLYTACLLLMERWQLLEQKKAEPSATLLVLRHPVVGALLLLAVFVWFQAMSFAPSESDERSAEPMHHEQRQK